MFFPRRDLISLDMGVEEAVKMVVSGGIVTPEDPRAGNRPARSLTAKKKTAVKNTAVKKTAAKKKVAKKKVAKKATKKAAKKA